MRNGRKKTNITKLPSVFRFPSRPGPNRPRSSGIFGGDTNDLGVPQNERKLTLHKTLEELNEKILKFPKTTQGLADPNATVEYEGHELFYADFLHEKDEARNELTERISKASITQ